MGPYGVDRTVHSMDFTDCENGLGEYSTVYQFLKKVRDELQDSFQQKYNSLATRKTTKITCDTH